MKYRTKPRTAEQICEGIEIVKTNARDDLKAIHLVPCDFNEVWLSPAKFNAVKQKDGTIRTIFKGHLIPIVAVK